ncbi:hypothetical protein NDU88_003673 [Pleurodeles waltl]|uniref:Uncharacterized protein n=1 Tax=Pleurodeles waltl TaxID=8319 RepID=A0AAV7VHG4_PLEWA|nr:hypothetical protein NDU88_003673 [Pleurodeles waltl]
MEPACGGEAAWSLHRGRRFSSRCDLRAAGGTRGVLRPGEATNKNWGSLWAQSSEDPRYIMPAHRRVHTFVEEPLSVPACIKNLWRGRGRNSASGTAHAGDTDTTAVRLAAQRNCREELSDAQ